VTDINSARAMQPGGVYARPDRNVEPVLDLGGMTDAAVADEVTDEQIEEAAAAAALLSDDGASAVIEEEPDQPVILRKKAPAKTAAKASAKETAE